MNGTLIYKGEERKFNFNKENYVLTIYEEINGFELFIKRIQDNTKNHKWFEQLTIEGYTNKEQVVFKVLDNPYSVDGFLTYSVDWYYIYQIKSEINSLIFKSKEVNSFYLNRELFKAEVDKEFSVITIKRSKSKDCGSFIYKDKVATASLDVSSNVSYIKNTPVEINALFNVKFDNYINLEDAIEVIEYINRFFQYITYRRNSYINTIETYTIINRKYVKSGEIHIKDKYIKENKENTKIIDYEVLGTNTSNLIQCIVDNKINMQQICDTSADFNSYPIYRFLMIASELERELRNLYSSKYGRSKEYYSIRNDVVKYLENRKEKENSKGKRIIDSLCNMLKNTDVSLSEKIRKLLNDEENIFKKTIINNYEGEYSDIALSIGQRVSKLRNDIAHNNDIDTLPPETIIDFRIMEMLIYEIRLKDILKDDDKVSECLKKLFNNIFLVNDKNCDEVSNGKEK